MVSINDITEEPCRLCGSEEGIKVSIFEPGVDHVKKIHRILPITISEHDSLPKIMCHRCSFKVSDFYEFRTNCIKTQDLFKDKLPWLHNKSSLTCDTDFDQTPMVELPFNSIGLNYISPREKLQSTGSNFNETVFIDENEPLIVIDDDSSCEEVTSTAFDKNRSPKEKLIMKIKRSDLKKKPKSKCVWESKKRRKRTYNSCRITEVFTTSLDDHDNLGDQSNDPLGASNIEETSENIHNIQKTNNLTDQGKENVKDGIQLPPYILVTHIPRVGFVYTCEKCGRTFLSPQPASLHTCNQHKSQDDEFRTNHINDQRTSTNIELETYYCKECDKVFTRQSQLSAHMKTHYNVDSSSSEESKRPVSRRKKPCKNKDKSKLLKTATIPTMPPSSNFENEDGIRHFLLSSDSE